MKIIYLMISISLFIGCSSKLNGGKVNDCNENREFKETFFNHVENIERNIFVRQDSAFKNSLIFISRYTHVSLEEMLNYAGLYPSSAFETDKKGWIQWYEGNKCNYIRFK
ncbi:MAG: hypothetical protein KA319_02635 [Ferruginibacter sp.]|nr:hypothetical protein [Ferruginibacter sp.]